MTVNLDFFGRINDYASNAEPSERNATALAIAWAIGVSASVLERASRQKVRAVRTAAGYD
jgi:hypothetical protein